MAARTLRLCPAERNASIEHTPRVFHLPAVSHAPVLRGMLPRMRSILVIRAGALGDALLTLPALAALRTRWPDAQITMVAPRAILPFALASGLADASLPFEGEAGLALSQEGRPLPGWAMADLAVVWLRQWEAAAGRLAACGTATVLASPSIPPEGVSTHVANHLLATLTPLGIGLAWLARPLRPPAESMVLAHEQFPSFPPGATVIAVHPGSGGPAKCWPQPNYQRLIDRLVVRGFAVLICLGPAEEQRAAEWQVFAAERRYATCVVGAPLPVLAALLQRCAGYVGNDAGVTHLAAALGVPTVALFGPTDPARWAPLGPRVQVLRDPDWSAGSPAESGRWSLGVEAVEEAVLSLAAGGARPPRPQCWGT